MKKALRYGVLGICAILVLLLVLIAFAVVTLDVNKFRGQLSHWVQQKTGRQLLIPGALDLKLLPRISLKLGPVTLNEKDSTSPFASVKHAEVTLSPWALMKKEIRASDVVLEGVDVKLKRFKDGTTNFDDLLSKDSEPTTLVLDLKSVKLTNSSVSFDDEMAVRRIAASGIAIETGRIAEGVASPVSGHAQVKGTPPQLDAAIDFKALAMINLREKRYAIRNLDATLKGAFAALQEVSLHLTGSADLAPKRLAVDSIAATLNAKQGERQIAAQVSVKKLLQDESSVNGDVLQGSLKLSQLSLTLDAKFQAPALSVKDQLLRAEKFTFDGTGKVGAATLNFQLAAPLSGNLAKKILQADAVKLDGTWRDPDSDLSASLRAPVSANWERGDFIADIAKLTWNGKARGYDTSGAVSTALSGNVFEQRFRFANVQGDGSGSKARESWTAKLSGSMDADLRNNAYRSEALALEFAGKLNGKDLRGSVSAPQALAWGGGQMAPGVIASQFTLSDPSEKLELVAKLAGTVSGTAESLRISPLVLTANGKHKGGTVKAQLRAQVDAATAGREFRLSNLTADGWWEDRGMKGGGVRAILKGEGTVALAQERLALNLRGKLDGGTVSGSIKVDGFAKPAYGFDLNIDVLDLHRYGARDGKPATTSKKPKPEELIDFTALQTINAVGTIRVGLLKSQAVTMKKAKIEVR